MKRVPRPLHSLAGFTLTEMLVSVSVFSLLIAGLMASHLFGLQRSVIASIKLSASDDARRTVSQMLQDIRSAASIRVGTGGLNTFTEVVDGASQAGTAIQLYKSSNTNEWIRYYYSAADNTLRKTEDGLVSSLVTANSITNYTSIFTLEDFTGTVYTNRQISPVVDINLSFTDIKNPNVPIGTGLYFDFYHFQTRVTPRIKQ